MVVYLDGNTHQLAHDKLSSPQAAIHAVLSCQTVANSSHQLVSKPPTELGPAGLLYLHQRECALVRSSDPAIQLLASDDATTCHLIVVRNPISCDTFMCHFDGVGVSSLLEIIDKRFSSSQSGAKLNSSNYLDLHLIGGFNDSRGESAALTLGLLRALCRSRLRLRLRTACLSQANGARRSDGHIYPIITGLAVSLADGRLTPASVPLSARGPWQALRGLRFLSAEDCVFEVYDPDRRCLVLRPFNYGRSHMFDFYPDEPDSVLATLSTSPRQEPAHFVHNMRKSLRFGRANRRPNQQVFHLGDIVERPLPGGAWQHEAGSTEKDLKAA